MCLAFVWCFSSLLSKKCAITSRIIAHLPIKFFSILFRMQIESRSSTMLLGRCGASLFRIASSSSKRTSFIRSKRPLSTSNTMTSSFACASNPIPFGLMHTTSPPPSPLLPPQPCARSRSGRHSFATLAAASVEQASSSTPTSTIAPESGLPTTTTLTLSDLPTSDQSDTLLRIRHSVRSICYILSLTN